MNIILARFLCVCFGHGWIHSILPFVGGFGLVSTSGSYFVVPDIFLDPYCIHRIKDRTLPFPRGPASMGRTQQCWTELLSWRCLAFMSSLFHGLLPPDYSAQCRKAPTRWFSSLLCLTLYFKLTSRFGTVLGAPSKSSSTCFLQLGNSVESRSWLTSFKLSPSVLFLVEFLTSVLHVNVNVLRLWTRCRFPPDASLRLSLLGGWSSCRW